MLTSRIGVDFATITWQRTDTQGTLTYGWNIAGNRPV